MNWLLRLFRRSRLERDIQDEIAFHKHMRERDPDAPVFGNEVRIQEQMREQWTLVWLESTGYDLIYAMRTWRNNPVFTATLIASLALAIGAVIAIFTAADDLLFRPLPYGDPGSLVMLWETNRSSTETTRTAVSPDNFLDWQARNSVFQDMAYVDEGQSVFGDGERNEELQVQRVPPDFFKILAVQPYRGSATNGSSADRGNENDVVISYRLWRNWFGGAPNIIGRSVQLDSFQKTIVGVMPPGFSFGNRDVDLWPYMSIHASAAHDRGARNMQVLARLKPEVGLGQARAQMTAIARQLERTDPQFNKNWTVTVEGLRDAFARKVKTSLIVLLISVGLLMIVACANAANLMLARFSARRSEIAMRAALGAGRWRLTKQLLTESFSLAAAAGILGLIFGRYALSGLVAIAPKALTQTSHVSIDWRIAVFAVGLTAFTGVLFGLIPSLVGGTAGLGVEAKFPKAGRTLGRRCLRAWLIASEIAVSVVLLTGGTVLFRSLLRLQHTESGLMPRNVLTFHFRVMSPHDIGRFSQAVSEIKRLPGVRSVSATSFLPFNGVATSTTVNVNGREAAERGQTMTAIVRTVMPGYFETIGIPVLRGREFADDDNTPQSPMRFVVNDLFARTYLDTKEPMAKPINVGMARNNPPGQVVGIVGDVKEGALNQAPVPTVYYVYAHMPYGQMTLVVRTERDPLALGHAVRQVIHGIDPKLAMANVQTMEEILGSTYARERFLTLLLGGFSACAVLLAAMGIYGILAYSVSLRTQEIGIRQAVGADGNRIIRMVLGNGAWFVGSGLVAGTAAAFVSTRLLSNVLFETPASDPLVFALAPAILLFVGLIAAYFPARRAARLDPVRALRFE